MSFAASISSHSASALGAARALPRPAPTSSSVAAKGIQRNPQGRITFIWDTFVKAVAERRVQYGDILNVVLRSPRSGTEKVVIEFAGVRGNLLLNSATNHIMNVTSIIDRKVIESIEVVATTEDLFRACIACLANRPYIKIGDVIKAGVVYHCYTRLTLQESSQLVANLFINLLRQNLQCTGLTPIASVPGSSEVLESIAKVETIDLSHYNIMLERQVSTESDLDFPPLTRIYKGFSRVVRQYFPDVRSIVLPDMFYWMTKCHSARKGYPLNVRSLAQLNPHIRFKQQASFHPDYTLVNIDWTWACPQQGAVSKEQNNKKQKIERERNRITPSLHTYTWQGFRDALAKRDVNYGDTFHVVFQDRISRKEHIGVAYEHSNPDVFFGSDKEFGFIARSGLKIQEMHLLHSISEQAKQAIAYIIQDSKQKMDVLADALPEATPAAYFHPSYSRQKAIADLYFYLVRQEVEHLPKAEISDQIKEALAKVSVVDLSDRSLTCQFGESAVVTVLPLTTIARHVSSVFSHVARRFFPALHNIILSTNPLTVIGPDETMVKIWDSYYDVFRRRLALAGVVVSNADSKDRQEAVTSNQEELLFFKNLIA